MENTTPTHFTITTTSVPTTQIQSGHVVTHPPLAASPSSYSLLHPPATTHATTTTTGSRLLHRSMSASFDGSSRQLTPRQLRSFEQSDGLTLPPRDSHDGDSKGRKRPVLLTTPRHQFHYALTDRSPIPRSIQTIPIDTVALPKWIAAIQQHQHHAAQSTQERKAGGAESKQTAAESDKQAAGQAESISPPSEEHGTRSISPPSSNSTSTPTPSLVRRASLALFQSLAIQNLTLASANTPLDEWLKKSKELLQPIAQQQQQQEENILAPLDLRSENSAELLSEWVSATLEIEQQNLRAVQVVREHSSSNAHASTSTVQSTHRTSKSDAPATPTDSASYSSGDAVSLILDTTRAPPKLVGVVKVFSNYKTFEQELLAITRMHTWLEMKYKRKEADDTGSSSSTSVIPMSSSTPTSRSSSPITPPVLHVPTPLGAHFALTPTGRGGVLVMAAADGSPLDDYFLTLATRRSTGMSTIECEQAWSEVKEGIGLAATAFFQLHTLPKGSGGKVRKKYLQKYIHQAENILDRIQEKLAPATTNDNAQSSAPSLADLQKQYPQYATLFDVSHLRSRLAPFISGVLQNRGSSCVVHGDAHCGNIFFDVEKKIITLIDVPTVNMSVGERGEPIGCAARDIANVYQKIEVTGSKHKCTPQEILHLQTHFIETYEKQYISAGLTSPVTFEAFHFFHLRSVLGELHRAIKYHTLQPHVLQSVEHAFAQAETYLQRKNARAKTMADTKVIGNPSNAKNNNNTSSSELVGDEDDQVDDRLALMMLDEERIQEKLFEEELIRKEIERDEIRQQDALAETGGIRRTHHKPGEEDDEDSDLLDEEDEEAYIRKAREAGHRESIYSLSPLNSARRIQQGGEPSGVDPFMDRQQSEAFQSYSTIPSFLPSSINGGRILVVLGAPLKSDLSTPDVWLESRLKQAVSIFYRAQHGLSAVILSGGRSPGMEVSVSKVMERWLRPFGIRAMSSRFTLLNEDMSTCVSTESYPRDLISQAFCIRSLLRMKGFYHGNLLVICSDFQLASVCIVFNRIFKSSNGMIICEYIGSPTPRLHAPDKVVEASRLKELPSLMKEMKQNYALFTPYGNSSTADGRAPSLLEAARAGSLQNLKHIIESNPRGRELINTEKDHLGCSPLHLAAEAGFTDCVEYLLQQGADPNARSTLGATPLHFSTSMLRLEVVELLLAYGGGPSRTLVGVCGRGERRDCWLGSKRPCDMFQEVSPLLTSSTHLLQDLQPARSVITLLVQPESVTLREAEEEIMKEHETALKRMKVLTRSGMSRSSSKTNLAAIANENPTACHSEQKSSTNSTTAVSIPLPPSTSSFASPSSSLTTSTSSLSLTSPLSSYPNLPSKRVFLLRHSESLWNVNGSYRVRGLIDTSLTNAGVKQAKQLGRLLKKTGALQRLGVKLIAVSPLTRTIQTYMLAVRWYLDLFPARTNTIATAASILSPSGTIAENSSSTASTRSSSPAPLSSIRVCVRSELAEQLLSTGTIGRSPQQLMQDFSDPSLDFSHLPPIWWYAPIREDMQTQQGSNATTIADNGSATPNASPASSAAVPNSTTAAPPPPQQANTRVYLKKEPLEHVRYRIHLFLQWLDEQPETSVLVVGHGTFFRYMVDTEMRYPDIFNNNLMIWRL